MTSFCRLFNNHTFFTRHFLNHCIWIGFFRVRKFVLQFVVIQIKLFVRKLLKIVIDEINALNGTDYTSGDVYFKFDRQIPTNMLEKAQIELTEAQKRQTEINTVLNLATHLDSETTMQLICEQLDIDYNDIKDKLPDPEETDPYAMVEEVPGEEGVLIE
jgi:hypothetical protein